MEHLSLQNLISFMCPHAIFTFSLCYAALTSIELGKKHFTEMRVTFNAGPEVALLENALVHHV